jgi:FkbM family methyltransferase
VPEPAVTVRLPTTALADGTTVHCLRRAEARVLDHHVQGYLEHGIDVSDGDVVFDVGANIGLLGVRACQRHPGVKVYAFEPVPPIFEACRRNAEQHGGGRFRVFNVGLSSAAGEARFTWYPNAPALSTARPEDWEGDPHAWREAVRGQLKAMPEEMWWARLVPGVMLPAVAWFLRRGAVDVVCPLRTLSSVVEDENIDRIDLLKIDCEGFELDVLEGIRDEHWPRVQKVVVEVHDHDGRADTVAALLRKHGLSRIVREKEDAFAATALINLYASRPPEEPS